MSTSRAARNHKGTRLPTPIRQHPPLAKNVAASSRRFRAAGVRRQAPAGITHTTGTAAPKGRAPGGKEVAPRGGCVGV